MLMNNGRLIEINAFPDPSASENDSIFTLGSIFVGKVKNVVKNINSAFVELSPGKTAFLSLEHLNSNIHPGVSLLNRPFDGRILAGDEILVQVQKEAVKTKDPVLTTALSLTGRYSVLEAVNCPDTKGKLHFSGKLSVQTKNAVREYLEEYTDQKLQDALQKFNVIVRTNVSDLTGYESLCDEILSLSSRLQHIIDISGCRTCYSCLYRPESPWLTEIRDTYSSQYEEIVTDDVFLYQELHNYLEQQYPEELPRLRQYTDARLSLKSLYGLNAKLKEATEPRIWLKSGGYLVIEQTEALTVIDVNSGKYSGKKGTSDTWRLINREAAEEIARQLRLRNYSGIIIVDFINMDYKRDEEELLKFLSSELRKDPVKTIVVDMTPLGLVEITRKKIRKSLKEQLET